jgi:hypothetical protein
MRERLREEARPRALVQQVRGVLLAAADLVDDDATLLAEAIVRDGRLEELLGEEPERRLDVLVKTSKCTIMSSWPVSASCSPPSSPARRLIVS